MDSNFRLIKDNPRYCISGTGVVYDKKAGRYLGAYFVHNKKVVALYDPVKERHTAKRIEKLIFETFVQNPTH